MVDVRQGSHRGALTGYEAATWITYTPRDIRFTRNGDTVYAIFLAWPKEPIMIRTPVGRRLSAHAGEWSIGPAPEPWGEASMEVQLLGSEESVEWERTEEGLRVTFPDERPGRYAYALRIDLDPE